MKKPFALMSSSYAVISLKSHPLVGPLKLLLYADSVIPEAESFLKQVCLVLFISLFPLSLVSFNGSHLCIHVMSFNYDLSLKTIVP